MSLFEERVLADQSSVGRRSVGVLMERRRLVLSACLFGFGIITLLMGPFGA